MSVSDPVDSGGGLLAMTQNLQDFSEKMSTVGAWAEMMAEEELSTSKTNPEVSTPRGSRRQIPDEPPFKVQVTGISSNVIEEDLYYLLGGEEAIKDFDINRKRGNAHFEFKTQEGLRTALQKSGEMFEGRELKVFLISNIDRAPATESGSGDVRQDRNYSGYNANQNQGQGQPYSRQASRYTSQSSVYSNEGRNSYRKQSYGYDGYRDRDSRYSGRDSREDRRDYGRGYGGRGGRYERERDRDYMPGGLNRSGSYSYDRPPAGPAPISRSQTESSYDIHGTGRRTELSSRASSRLSVADDDRPAIRKPSSQDIFGGAKPVNTADKMLEIEEKLERERQERANAEKAKEKERERLQSQQHHHQSHHHYPHGHGHNPHHQQQISQQTYNTAPPNYYHNQYANQYSPYGMQFTPSQPEFVLQKTSLPVHVPQMSPSTDQSSSMNPVPGSVRILQHSRVSTDQESVTTETPSDPIPVNTLNSTPPLDPVHPSKSVQALQAKAQDSTSTAPSETKNAPKDAQPQTAGTDGEFKKPTKIRTFHPTQKNQNSTNSEASVSRGSHRGRGGFRGVGGRGGRGRGALGSGPGQHMQDDRTLPNERRNSTSSQKQASGVGDNKPAQSHQSLRSHGHDRRGGHPRGGSGRGRGPREHRPSREAGEHHSQNSDTASKADDVTETTVNSSSVANPTPSNPNVASVVCENSAKKPPSTPVSVPVTSEIVSSKPSEPAVKITDGAETKQTEDVKEKKKEKKKNKKDSKQLQRSFNNNKFAALLDAE